jgi:hypothetical protein
VVEINGEMDEGTEVAQGSEMNGVAEDTVAAEAAEVVAAVRAAWAEAEAGANHNGDATLEAEAAGAGANGDATLEAESDHNAVVSQSGDPDCFAVLFGGTWCVL